MVARIQMPESLFYDYAAPLVAEKFNVPASFVDKHAQQTWKLLGEGAYGQVLLGVCDSQKVAIKCLKQRLYSCSKGDSEQQLQELCLQHLWNEISMLRTLQHRNIVSFLGAAQTEDNIYMFSEFCERGSVDRLLHRPQTRPQLNIKRILNICTDTARAMAFMHSQSPAVLHCDFKPANLLVTRDWTVKVADFGNSRHVSDPVSLDLEGTIEYCAPEVLAGGQFTKAADVWSFGVTLWELLMQQRPYQDCGMNRYMLVMLITSGSLRLPAVGSSRAPSALIRIMEACLDPCPEARPSFQKILEMLEDIVTLPTTDLAGGKHVRRVPSKSALTCDFESPIGTHVTSRAHVSSLTHVSSQEDPHAAGDSSKIFPQIFPQLEVVSPRLSSSPDSRAASPFAMYASCIHTTAGAFRDSPCEGASPIPVDADDKVELSQNWSCDSFDSSATDCSSFLASNCVSAGSMELSRSVVSSSSSSCRMSTQQTILPNSSQTPCQISSSQMYPVRIESPEWQESAAMNSCSVQYNPDQYKPEQYKADQYKAGPYKADQYKSDQYQLDQNVKQLTTDSLSAKSWNRSCASLTLTNCHSLTRTQPYPFQSTACPSQVQHFSSTLCGACSSWQVAGDGSPTSCTCLHQGRVKFTRRKFASVDCLASWGGLGDGISPGNGCDCEGTNFGNGNSSWIMRFRKMNDLSSADETGIMQTCEWEKEKLQHRRGLFLDKG